MDSISPKNNTPILTGENLSVTFGRLAAVSNLPFQIYPEEIFGLIGPNGAGKTTVFNALTGTVPLSSGRIFLSGRDIHGLKPHQITSLGMVRVFQSATIFPQAPVAIHVMSGLHCRTSSTILGGVLKTPFNRKEEKQNLQRVKELLSFAHLDGLEEQPAANLTWAQQKRLMLATALATEPTLILLDEPVAGMNNAEIEEMIELINIIRREGKTVFIIDHNMKVMMRICDRILVMSYGQRLTEGVPEEIAKDPKVIEAYLGYKK